MTKTVEEVRRAAFEAFAATKWPHVRQYRRDALPVNHERYGEYVMLECEWQAFNAGLDAVEIQLPDCTEFDFPSGAAPAIQECRVAIEQTGLGLRVK